MCRFRGALSALYSQSHQIYVPCVRVGGRTSTWSALECAKATEGAVCRDDDEPLLQSKI